MVLVVSLHYFPESGLYDFVPNAETICQFIFARIGIISRIIYIILIERMNIPLLFDMLSKHGFVISKLSFVSNI